MLYSMQTIHRCRHSGRWIEVYLFVFAVIASLVLMLKEIAMQVDVDITCLINYVIVFLCADIFGLHLQ